MAKKRRRAAPDLSESDVMFTEHDSVLTRHPTLIDQIKQTADGLKQDKTSRGDLKILSRALRELRYAFKVFAPFRRQRKVSVFGRARNQHDDPTYLQ